MHLDLARFVLARADGLAQEVRRLTKRALRHHRLTLALGVEIGLRLRGEVGLRLPLTRQVLAELPFPLRLAEPPKAICKPNEPGLQDRAEIAS